MSFDRYDFALLGAGLVLLALLMITIMPAHGQEHRHPDATYTDKVGRFYETWMRPDNPGYSCCSRRDCAPVRAVRRAPDGTWEAQRDSDGAWLRIPAARIEQHKDSPNTDSHMCAIPGTYTVLCFVFGSGT